MFTIRDERVADVAAREALLDAAFGDARFAKTAERLREGRVPADGLSFIACSNAGVIGSVRLWNVSAGAGRSALLLGPLAVTRYARSHGVGAALMTHALGAARRAGHSAVLLVGDAPYYGRFGFSRQNADGLWLPGPFERERLLGCELEPGALASAGGMITAAGEIAAIPSLLAHAPALVGNDNVAAHRAA